MARQTAALLKPNIASFLTLDLPIPPIEKQKELISILNLLNKQYDCINKGFIELTKFKKRFNDGIFKGEVKV